MGNADKTLNQIIWGENPYTFYFSFNGTFNRLQFFGALITLNVVFNLIAKQGIIFLTVLCGLIVFYASLAAIQKRCRDIKSTGSLCIFIFSVAFPATHYLRYAKEQSLIINSNVEKLMGILIGGYLLVYLFLQFMPGAKEKDQKIISPLLVCPKIYLAICTIIYSAIFFVFNKIQ